MISYGAPLGARRPPAGSSVHLLGSLSCAPVGGCTAVGDYAAATGAALTLAEARP